MIEKLEERMGSRAQTGHTALCRMRDTAYRFTVYYVGRVMLLPLT